MCMLLLRCKVVLKDMIASSLEPLLQADVVDDISFQQPQTERFACMGNRNQPPLVLSVGVVIGELIAHYHGIVALVVDQAIELCLLPWAKWRGRLLEFEKCPLCLSRVWPLRRLLAVRDNLLHDGIIVVQGHGKVIAEGQWCRRSDLRWTHACMCDRCSASIRGSSGSRR